MQLLFLKTIIFKMLQSTITCQMPSKEQTTIRDCLNQNQSLTKHPYGQQSKLHIGTETKTTYGKPSETLLPKRWPLIKLNL